MARKNQKKRSAKSAGREIVPGISISPKNEATVDPQLSDVLFDLALKLEEKTGLAVDVQHALAAIVMGAQTGEVPSDQPISTVDEKLLRTLEKYVRVVFSNFDGKVGQDD